MSSYEFEEIEDHLNSDEEDEFVNDSDESDEEANSEDDQSFVTALEEIKSH